MSTSFKIKTIATKPFSGQKPGTSGLRKRVTEVKQEHYLENFVQACFSSLPFSELKGSSLVIGGDGRYYNDVAIQKIIKIAAANDVGKLLIGQNGLISTPAVSAIIRKRKCFGGIILTASHNPGGPEGDFGIKYNISNGGPAPEALTDEIYQATQMIKQYKIADIPDVDLSKVGHKVSWEKFEVEIIDSCSDYVELMKKIFDFDKIKGVLSGGNCKILLDSMGGATGPYVEEIFVKQLGASSDSCMNTKNLPDFGGGHPDPNLTYAKELVDKMYEGTYDLGAAFDGDGDRNMILGKKFFVTPSDSVAIIAANAKLIPHYKDGLKAVSRSMPTSQALDKVAEKEKMPIYVVPTGWKFFGNLMDKYEKEGSEGFICGEESFGTGSAHIREKDGIWAVLCWLQILAEKKCSVADIVTSHWKEYGRNYYSRYDYEGVDAKGADDMMDHLREEIKKAKSGDKPGDGVFELDSADEFEYTDSVDGSVSSQQGIRFRFKDGSRIVFRLSGTGSVGATVRVYLEKYVGKDGNIEGETPDVLKDLVKLALDISKLQDYTKRKEPTVIT